MISQHRHITLVFATMLSLLWSIGAGAFPTDTYSPHSRLAQGRWVKVSVDTTGIYMIARADLQAWGFTNLRRVRVFGYGGESQGNVLTADSYIDDLAVAPCELTDRGLVFYGRGPVAWSSDGSLSHSRNHYSTLGYYFVGEADSDEAAAIGEAINSATPPESPTTEFSQRLLHERELASGGKTGHTFLGESFRNNSTQNFTFDMPGHVGGTTIRLNCAFAARTTTGTSTIALSVNNKELPYNSQCAISAGGTDGHCHYLSTLIAYPEVKLDDISSRSMKVSVTFKSEETSPKLARLDYLELAYTRSLDLSTAVDGQLTFTLSTAGASLKGANSSTRLWDVSSRHRALNVATTLSGTTLSWRTADMQPHTYVAWQPDATFPSPTRIGIVEPQDIHATPTPNMVIITATEWLTQAQQIADIHRNNAKQPLTVEVYTQEQLFNEFSSGTPDINAFRRCLKMHYDRNPENLRYALLLGRGTYDHRALSPQASTTPILLQWQTVDGSNDNTSYTTDDYLAFLTDDSGQRPESDTHCIAVGRIPATSAAEASIAATKLKSYLADDNKDDWKNRMVLAADDEDLGEHLKQMEKAYNHMMTTPRGRNRLYTKAYVDAFPLLNKVATGAHDRMFRTLRRGAMWWWYIGHANTFSWTGEGLLTLSDLDAVNFAHQPILYAATCDFLRWDLPDPSGAESLYFNPQGVIATIAATRPVYISLNEDMSLAMAEAVTANTPEPLSIGQILQRAKNSRAGKVSDSNKLRYVLLGDPAIIPAEPTRTIALDSIDGKPFDPESQPTLQAQAHITLAGRVIIDTDGSTDTEFTGTLIPTIYDAERTTTSLGHGKGEIINFEEQGDALYIGRDRVDNGRFKASIDMPSEIAGIFRPAAINLYAFTSGGGNDASSVCRDAYVYGVADNSTTTDTEPPVIEMFALNTPAFSSGQTISQRATVIARLTDNRGINISSAGIGHRMSLLLDGVTTFSDLTDYYTPGDEGPRKGTISYPLTRLTDGPHTLRLRVWDTSNNYAEETIDFVVKNGNHAEIFNLQAIGATTSQSVSFHVDHNRATPLTTLTISVYDMTGRLVWTTTRPDRPENAGTPVEWDLTGNTGARVERGIYVVHATMTAPNEAPATKAQKFAVTTR